MAILLAVCLQSANASPTIKVEGASSPLRGRTTLSLHPSEMKQERPSLTANGLSGIFSSHSAKDKSSVGRFYSSEIILQEGFETQVPPEGWTLFDDDGDGRNWSWSFSPTHTGEGMAFSESFLPGPFGGSYNPDNWLISPKISIPTDGKYRLTYWIGYGNPQRLVDKYGIFVSETGTNPEDFEEIFSETLHNDPGSSYYSVELSLEKYAGKDIHIAFRHYDSTDGGQKLLLDDVTVDKIPIQPVFSGMEYLNFGRVCDINPDKYATYTILNAGTQPLEISWTSSSPELSVTESSLTIAPKESADLIVKLDNVAAGDYNGSFTLTTNDPNLPSVTIPVVAVVTEGVLTDFHFEAFENQEFGYPLGWTPAFFYSGSKGGINNSGAYYSGLDGTYGAQFTTNYVNMGDKPEVTFYYKAINSDGTPINADQLILGIYVSDNYETTDYKLAYMIQPGTDNLHKPTAGFQLLEVPLPDYAGKICKIGIKVFAANGGMGTFTLDNMSVGTRPASEIAAASMRGVEMPTVGVPSRYVVSVQNVGTAPIQKYTVRLMQKGGAELASVAGTPLEPNEYRNIELEYTPTTAGIAYYYGDVVMDGDVDADNNATPQKMIDVQDEGMYVCEVGDGETMTFSPINLFSQSSVQEALYYAHELGVNAGKINAIRYTASVEDAYDDADVMIFIVETDRNDFADGQWIEAADMALVYSGPLKFDFGDEHEYMTIPFDIPFEYNGGNIAVLVHMAGNDVLARQNFFYCTQLNGSKRDLQYVLNYDNIDVDNLAQGYSSGYIPNLDFYMTFDEMGAISGSVKDIAGNPIGKARVELTGTRLFTQTDEFGHYAFSHLTPGEYTVTVAESTEFESASLQSDVEVDVVSDVNFSLTPKMKVSLSGNIKRADNGAGIEGAEVIVDGISNHKAISDAQGHYSIDGVCAGYDYTIEVTSAGYITYTTSIDIARENMNFDVELDEKNLPVQLLKAQPDGENAHISWLKPNSIPETEFRYDSNVRMGQLGLSEQDEDGLMGSVHKTPSVVNEISWFLANDGMPHPMVDLYLLDLDGNGKPTSNVLYSVKGVENIDDKWNTYTLPHPVSAPNGFMVAVSNAYGFVGIGIAVPTDEYPFMEDRNFYTQDYTGGVFIPLEEANYRMNFMIRANGIYMNDEPGESQSQVKEYSVYRLAEGQPETEWTSLGMVTETEYVDNQWNSLPAGVYYYAARAHYAKHESVAAISNMMPKDMTVKATINITTNVDTQVDGAVVTLKNLDGNSEHIYSRVIAGGSVLFDSVWKGNYDVEAVMEGFDTVMLENVEMLQDKVLDIVLKETIPAPYGLQVILNDSDFKFTWNNEPQVAFWDDIEGYSDFIIDNIGSYTLIDNDKIPTWVLAYTATSAYVFPNNGYQGSYIVMNPEATIPQMTSMFQTYSGSKMLACVDANNSSGPGCNDDWLILPQLEITEGMKLKFQALSVAQMYGEERIKVGVSTSGTNISDFTFLTNGGPSIGDNYFVPFEWTRYEFDLSKYAGQKIYIAIACVSSNAYMLGIDDIFVGTSFNDITNLEQNKVAGQNRIKSEFVNYTIYLGEVEMGTSQSEEFSFSGLVDGEYMAGVKAVYSNGESEIVYTPFKVESTGVENVETDMLRLSPNPFVDEIRISDPASVKRMVITDMAGHVVKVADTDGLESVLVDEISSGFYLVTAETNDGDSRVFKMIKK